MNDVAVIGAGAWGTALSIVLSRNDARRVRLWAFEPEVAAAINERRTNHLFLPTSKVPASVTATHELKTALDGAAIVVVAVPSNHFRRLMEEAAALLPSGTLFVSATKGLENETLLRMSEVASQVLQQRGVEPRVGALSGPSFAREVARGDPTAVTIASKDADLAATVQRDFSDPAFRVYTNDDVAGVELGGALKNVIAIAAGICHGLGLGHNSIAALITRGLAEITRLTLACGGRRETMAGLAGVGDLVLTCTGALSRNRTLGVELGRGRKLPEIIAGMHGMVAEGVLTTNAAVELARRHGVEMPISEQVHAILHKEKPPHEAIRELMSRPATGE